MQIMDKFCFTFPREQGYQERVAHIYDAAQVLQAVSRDPGAWGAERALEALLGISSHRFVEAAQSGQLEQLLALHINLAAPASGPHASMDDTEVRALGGTSHDAAAPTRAVADSQSADDAITARTTARTPHAFLDAPRRPHASDLTSGDLSRALSIRRSASTEAINGPALADEPSSSTSAGNSSAAVSAREEAAPDQAEYVQKLVELIKEEFHVRIDSAEGVDAVLEDVPEAPENEKKKIQPLEWDAHSLEQLRVALQHYAPITGPRRAHSSRSGIPQEVVVVGRATSGFVGEKAESKFAGEYFAPKRLAVFYYLTPEQERAHIINSMSWVATHEIAHGLLDYAQEDFTARFWKDPEGPLVNFLDEEVPVNREEDFKASILFYITCSDFSTGAPKHFEAMKYLDTNLRRILTTDIFARVGEEEPSEAVERIAEATKRVLPWFETSFGTHVGIWKKDGSRYWPEDESPITEYAQKSAKEDLAETMMVFLNDPLTLQRFAPKRAHWAGNVVAGWTSGLPSANTQKTDMELQQLTAKSAGPNPFTSQRSTVRTESPIAPKTLQTDSTLLLPHPPSAAPLSPSHSALIGFEMEIPGATVPVHSDSRLSTSTHTHPSGAADHVVVEARRERARRSAPLDGGDAQGSESGSTLIPRRADVTAGRLAAYLNARPRAMESALGDLPPVWVERALGVYGRLRSPQIVLAEDSRPTGRREYEAYWADVAELATTGMAVEEALGGSVHSGPSLAGAFHAMHLHARSLAERYWRSIGVDEPGDPRDMARYRELIEEASAFRRDLKFWVDSEARAAGIKPPSNTTMVRAWQRLPHTQRHLEVTQLSKAIAPVLRGGIPGLRARGGGIEAEFTELVNLHPKNGDALKNYRAILAYGNGCHVEIEVREFYIRAGKIYRRRQDAKKQTRISPKIIPITKVYYPILEFVTHVQGVLSHETRPHENAAFAALEGLEKRFATRTSKSDTIPMEDLFPESDGWTLTEEAHGGWIGAVSKEQPGLRVQYTLGVRVHGLREFLEHVHAHTWLDESHGYLTRAHLTDGLQFGDQVAALYESWHARHGSARSEPPYKSPHEQNIAPQTNDTAIVGIRGYIALLYTQFAALVQIWTTQNLLNKSLAAVLSRTPMNSIAAALPEQARSFLATEAEAVMNAMERKLRLRLPDFAEKYTKLFGRNEIPPHSLFDLHFRDDGDPLVREYVLSALKGKQSGIPEEVDVSQGNAFTMNDLAGLDTDDGNEHDPLVVVEVRYYGEAFISASEAAVWYRQLKATVINAHARPAGPSVTRRTANRPGAASNEVAVWTVLTDHDTLNQEILRNRLRNADPSAPGHAGLRAALRTHQRVRPASNPAAQQPTTAAGNTVEDRAVYEITASATETVLSETVSSADTHTAAAMEPEQVPARPLQASASPATAVRARQSIPSDLSPSNTRQADDTAAPVRWDEYGQRFVLDPGAIATAIAETLKKQIEATAHLLHAASQEKERTAEVRVTLKPANPSQTLMDTPDAVSFLSQVVSHQFPKKRPLTAILTLANGYTINVCPPTP